MRGFPERSDEGPPAGRRHAAPCCATYFAARSFPCSRPRGPSAATCRHRFYVEAQSCAECHVITTEWRGIERAWAPSKLEICRICGTDGGLTRPITTRRRKVQSQEQESSVAGRARVHSEV